MGVITITIPDNNSGGGGSPTAGNGITITDNQIAVNPLTNSGLGFDAGQLAITAVPVGRGGTSSDSFPANSVLLGNGGGPIGSASPDTDGYVLTSNGPDAAPTFQAPSGGVGGALIVLAGSAKLVADGNQYYVHPNSVSAQENYFDAGTPPYTTRNLRDEFLVPFNIKLVSLQIRINNPAGDPVSAWIYKNESVTLLEANISAGESLAYADDEEEFTCDQADRLSLVITNPTTNEPYWISWVIVAQAL